jgi:hypothetical protein
MRMIPLMKRLCAVGTATVLSTAALLFGASGVPASAAPGDTIVTVVLSGGALSVAVQPTAALAGAAGSASVSGPLGAVVVTDARGGTTPWALSASSTTFTGPVGTISSSVVYNAGAFTTTGNVTMTAAAPVTLTTTAAAVASAATVRGVNTATWTPTLTVGFPSDAIAGTYTGTVHSSVA